MTNIEHIKSLPPELLATYLVRNNWHFWRTTDGRVYKKYSNAIKHEIEWLKMEHKNLKIIK